MFFPGPWSCGNMVPLKKATFTNESWQLVFLPLAKFFFEKF